MNGNGAHMNTKRILSLLLALALCLAPAPGAAFASGELVDVAGDIEDVAAAESDGEAALSDAADPVTDGDYPDWRSAYAVALRSDTDAYACYGQLLDIDLNGVPELLIGYAIGTGLFSQLYSAYTFRDGQLVRLTAPDLTILGNTYQAYRSDAGGKCRVEMTYTIRMGAGNASEYIGAYTLSGTTLRFTTVFESATHYDTVTYYEGSTELAGESAYNAAIAAWRSGWTADDSFVYVSAYWGHKATNEEILTFLGDYIEPFDAAGKPVLGDAAVVGGRLPLTWSAVTGAERYAVCRRESGGEWVTLATVAGTEYTDASPLVGTASYRVRAYDDDGGAWGAYSSSKTVTYNPFTDVSTGAGYFKYVAWAYNGGIVKGTSATTFSPSADCTRGQFALMLYRMAGRPDVTGLACPFTDVKASAPYYGAVLWAYDQGVIKGRSATTFDPSGSVTRGQIVLMLYRMAGKPAVSGVDNPFNDVKPSDSYYRAVLWAVSVGVTNGTSATTFTPDKNCTRSQLVTFLYRYGTL